MNVDILEGSTVTVFAVKHGFSPIELILGAIYSWYSGKYCDCIQHVTVLAM